MLVEALKPLRVKTSAGTLRLMPGTPVNLPDEQGAKLLAKAPDKVRMVEAGPITVPANAGDTPQGPDFTAANLAVRIKSDVLGGAEIWLASNTDVLERLTAEGLSPVFLPEELPLLRGLGSDDLRRICEIKRVFPAATVCGDSGPVLPGMSNDHTQEGK